MDENGNIYDLRGNFVATMGNEEDEGEEEDQNQSQSQ
jgi:hypothetical protein